jgi:hypothetical protein
MVEVFWSRLFHLFSKAWAQARIEPNLFSKFFKPAKARVQKYETRARPEPAKIRPDPPLVNGESEIFWIPFILFSAEPQRLPPIEFSFLLSFFCCS